MPDNTSISAMLRLRKINPDEVVVELNREIVDKASFETRTLQAADIVEVLRFVGGG
jgi:thiamine biosynthesis protein ThiS